MGNVFVLSKSRVPPSWPPQPSPFKDSFKQKRDRKDSFQQDNDSVGEVLRKNDLKIRFKKKKKKNHP